SPVVWPMDLSKLGRVGQAASRQAKHSPALLQERRRSPVEADPLDHSVAARHRAASQRGPHSIRRVVEVLVSMVLAFRRPASKGPWGPPCLTRGGRNRQLDSVAGLRSSPRHETVLVHLYCRHIASL